MLRFCFGASGSGKSHRLYEEIIDRSTKDTDRNYLIIVPDQFTMQTQMDIVRMHPDQGIMNIDVLSFGRLSHRIFEETGRRTEAVLDDVGKSLILRHVADLNKDDLPVIGSHMHRAGYIDEVKSTISELMQYDVGPDQMKILIDNCQSRRALKSKLSDLQLLYQKFQEYTEGKYVTPEETLSFLCKRLAISRLVRDSVIVFDGFTGFTPIQYRVIEELLACAGEVIVSLEMDDESDPYKDNISEQELFYLSKKTVQSLLKCEWRCLQRLDPMGTPDYDRWKGYRDLHNDDIVLKGTNYRLKGNAPMAFLEQNLFRYRASSYDGDSADVSDSIVIAQCDSPSEEVRQALIFISRMIRKDPELFYRDFAIVCGDLSTYGEKIRRDADTFGIPVYIDETRGIKLNPFIEYIRSALDIVRTDYSYETVFHFMRSGMMDFDDDKIDLLENYVRSLGIRGHKAWEDIFTRRPRSRRKADAKDDERMVLFLDEMNRMRQELVDMISPIMDNHKKTVLELSKGLYEFIQKGNAGAKLLRYAERFAIEGDVVKADEYSQIYGKIMELLDQVTLLLGDEKISLKEYMEILDAGFGEIEVGTIPQNVDTVRVGDIERSRLSNIKYLLFLGVNDTNIPKHASEGGILSDIDRQFLMTSVPDIELAPSPRQQMYIQRLYLYMNLTKPSKLLYMSYAGISADGKSLNPAYIIGKIRALFPDLKVRMPGTDPIERQLLNMNDARTYICMKAREYADGNMKEDEEKKFLTLYDILNKDDPAAAKRVHEAAFLRYTNSPLPKALASALYGNYLENSVSRLEVFASCCYEHFVKYGLMLDERSEYDFDNADLGNVFHSVLELFSLRLEEKGIEWTKFTDEQGQEILSEVIQEVTGEYGENILYSSARNVAAIDRMYRILLRSVKTLRYQLQKGDFKPEKFELDFKEAGNIDEINIALTPEEETRIRQKMQLHGRIDRMDIATDEDDNVYIKIIDFKSGNKSFDIASVYYGLQLQLVVYMNVAMAMERHDNPDKEVVPAAILYYHVADPLVDAKDTDNDPERINQKIIKELKASGVINADKKVIDLLDKSIAQGATESDILHVKLKKDGSFYASSQVMENDSYMAVSSYVRHKIREYGRRILDGDIEVNPYSLGNKNACTYCNFRSICGFDVSTPGYQLRELSKLSEDEVMTLIKDEGQHGRS
ncbi:MAG: exodeoxyribonuclease V subunit gamma [Butyrivibrio sp.]|nr:exodeoxyribonuclease V subunit gamma [Butyrivibrio sp.]